MKLVVGLGNPGPRYAETRHNVGVRILERFAADCGIALCEEAFDGRFGRGVLPAAKGAPAGSAVDIALLAPQTWMNASGESVLAAVRGLPVEDIAADLVVVYDDVDLPFGRLRIRPGGGPGGHRGVGSVIEWLETRAFARLRFGVGRPDGGTETSDWVLHDFDASEVFALERHLHAAADALLSILRDGVTVSMNRYNAGPETTDEDARSEHPSQFEVSE